MAAAGTGLKRVRGDPDPCFALLRRTGPSLRPPVTIFRKPLWERIWRSANRGLGIYPERHLWNAVHGYLSLLDATSAARPDLDDRMPGPVDDAR